jgi:putative beta-lysine N-acetyltransferase
VERFNDETMNDIIMKIGKSMLQHGKYNDRIYLMKLSMEDHPFIIEKLDRIASVKGYSKIFAKVPASAIDEFSENGYNVEAYIPHFYNGIEDVYFMGKFFSSARMINDKLEEMKEILNNARLKTGDRVDFGLPDDLSLKICNNYHVDHMAEIYKRVFETYPFPIHDPQYILKTMEENFIYFGIWKNNEIVALSSSEMDTSSQNVEMTDFATLPAYRGNGFAVNLLLTMEDEMRKRNMITSYTIARAASYGINVIFARMGYKYGGTLLKNTNISGSFENMNIWYKSLKET